MPRTTFAVFAVGVAFVSAAPAQPSNLAEQLRGHDPGIVVRGPVRQQPLDGMIAREQTARLREAVAADRAAWAEVRDRAGWEKLRKNRLRTLWAHRGFD